MTSMTRITKYFPYGEYIPWDKLVGKKTSQTSDDVKTALQNGEFYGPGGSREEFITWMKDQEPQWEKREGVASKEEFDEAHEAWEKEYKMLCEEHLLPASYLQAYREYRVGVYEQEKKLVPFTTFHTQLRKACRKQRKKEKLPDGTKMWERVEKFIDEKKCRIHLDSQGEACVELTKIGKRCKLLNLEGLPNVYTKTRQNESLLKEMKTGQQVCVRQKYLTSDEIQQRLQEAKKHGYSADPNKTDEVLTYLAEEFGLTYDKTALGEYQPVFKIYMAILGRLGREFRNRHKDGRNGDDFKIDNKTIDNYQFMYMGGDYQGLNRIDDGYYDASLALVAG